MIALAALFLFLACALILGGEALARSLREATASEWENHIDDKVDLVLDDAFNATAPPFASLVLGLPPSRFSAPCQTIALNAGGAAAQGAQAFNHSRVAPTNSAPVRSARRKLRFGRALME